MIDTASQAILTLLSYHITVTAVHLLLCFCPICFTEMSLNGSAMIIVNNFYTNSVCVRMCVCVYGHYIVCMHCWNYMECAYMPDYFDIDPCNGFQSFSDKYTSMKDLNGHISALTLLILAELTPLVSSNTLKFILCLYP